MWMQTHHNLKKKKVKNFATDTWIKILFGTEGQEDFTFWSIDFMDSDSNTVVVTGKIFILFFLQLEMVCIHARSSS